MIINNFINLPNYPTVHRFNFLGPEFILTFSTRISNFFSTKLFIFYNYPCCSLFNCLYSSKYMHVTMYPTICSSNYFSIFIHRKLTWYCLMNKKVGRMYVYIYYIVDSQSGFSCHSCFNFGRRRPRIHRCDNLEYRDIKS